MKLINMILAGTHGNQIDTGMLFTYLQVRQGYWLILHVNHSMTNMIYVRVLILWDREHVCFLSQNNMCHPSQKTESEALGAMVHGGCSIFRKKMKNPYLDEETTNLLATSKTHPVLIRHLKFKCDSIRSRPVSPFT